MGGSEIIIHRHMHRRQMLSTAIQGFGALMWGCGKDQAPRHDLLPADQTSDSDPTRDTSELSGSAGAGGSASGIGDFVNVGPLQPANNLGIRIPEGFETRLVAASGLPVEPSSHVWPDYPDGAVTLPLENGGYLYVCNSEVSLAGGVSVLEFDAAGTIRDAYSILSGTNRNCQGGLMPGGSYLSCEEVSFGLVYECRPRSREAATVRPLLGAFRHEAVAYDLENHHLYLTEDEPDGGFYRFVPAGLDAQGFADLSAGALEVAIVAADGSVRWIEVPDPEVRLTTPTRRQVTEMTSFSAPEGVWCDGNHVYMTTKGDNRVWNYSISSSTMSVLYDPLTAETPILQGGDAIVGASSGELFIAEDGGDMQVVILTGDGQLRPLLQIEGQDHSEVTGLAFDPSGTRLYFSSQRGNTRGLTYELRRTG